MNVTVPAPAPGKATPRPWQRLLSVLMMLGPITAPAAAGTYVVLESQLGDYIGGGQSATYTQVSGNSLGGKTGVSFSAGGYTYQMKTASGEMVPGTYTGATRYPFNLAGEPGLSVYGNGNGCNTLTGRFIVYEISFDAGGNLTRFAGDLEQHCDGIVPALYAFVRFNATIDMVDADSDTVRDIQDSCPAVPNVDQVDADGDGIGDACDPVIGETFVYLDSDPGDYIGGGKSSLFTPASGGPITISGGTGLVTVNAGGFTYQFAGKQGQTIGVGAYEGATRYPFNQPTEPGLSVYGNGRGCNTLTGRFEIQELSRDASGKIPHFAATFEQHCEGGAAALRGVVRVNAESAGTFSFAFADQANVPLNTMITSRSVLIKDMPGPASIGVSGATSSAYSINGGPFVSAPGTVTNGSTIRVRHVSSAFPDTEENTVVQVGGTTDVFTSRTVKYSLDDVASTTVDDAVSIDALSNDSGFAEPLDAGVWRDPGHGMVTITGSPGPRSGVRMIYTPAPGFVGVDSFEYWVESGSVVDYATVTVTVIDDDLDRDGIGAATDNCPNVANVGQEDSDGDGLGDRCDNCTLRPNPDQRDTDGDGYGNICDADLNNDGRVTTRDFGLFRARLNTTDANADFNGNGIVTSLDYAILRSYIGLAPGPSGLRP